MAAHLRSARAYGETGRNSSPDLRLVISCSQVVGPRSRVGLTLLSKKREDKGTLKKSDREQKSTVKTTRSLVCRSLH